jgi:hypothetical protein
MLSPFSCNPYTYLHKANCSQVRFPWGFAYSPRNHQTSDMYFASGPPGVWWPWMSPPQFHSKHLENPPSKTLPNLLHPDLHSRCQSLHTLSLSFQFGTPKPAASRTTNFEEFYTSLAAFLPDIRPRLLIWSEALIIYSIHGYIALLMNFGKIMVISRVSSNFYKVEMSKNEAFFSYTKSIISRF